MLLDLDNVAVEFSAEQDQDLELINQTLPGVKYFDNVKASGNANHFRINQLFHSKRRRSIKEILNSSYFKKVKSKQEQHIHTFSIFIEFTINSVQYNYCN